MARFKGHQESELRKVAPPGSEDVDLDYELLLKLIDVIDERIHEAELQWKAKARAARRKGEVVPPLPWRPNFDVREDERGIGAALKENEILAAVRKRGGKITKPTYEFYLGVLWADRIFEMLPPFAALERGGYFQRHWMAWRGENLPRFRHRKVKAIYRAKRSADKKPRSVRLGFEDEVAADTEAEARMDLEAIFPKIGLTAQEDRAFRAKYGNGDSNEVIAASLGISISDVCNCLVAAETKVAKVRDDIQS